MNYIYILQNQINHKIYVGQTNNPVARYREHKSRIKTRKSPLYSAIKNYGLDNFQFTVIESWDSQEESDEAEEFWICFFQSRTRQFGYNLSKGGRVNRGFNHSLEFKQNKSKQMKQYFENKIKRKELNYNAKLTLTQAQEIRKLFLSGERSSRELSVQFKVNRGTIRKILFNKSYVDFNYQPNFELIQNIQNNLLSARRRKIQIKDELGNIFPSIVAAAKYYSVHSETIRYRISHSEMESKLPKLTKL